MKPSNSPQHTLLLLTLAGLCVAPTPTPSDSLPAPADPRADAARRPEAEAGAGQAAFAPKASSYLFDFKLLSPFMQVHKLSPTSNNITCNDGSQVGYYIRQNVHSKSWIIYLQGGGYCGTHDSCQHRWRRNPHLMSSNYWPKSKSFDGILSSEPKDNPYLWNANHVYVPYCSSDSWTGSAPAHHNQTSSAADNQHRSTFAFMGSKIIERVLDSLYDDLAAESSLHGAKFILFAGDSAGGTGVILNLDKVNTIVQRRFNTMKANCSLTNEHTNCDAKQAPILRGLADSGWFLDNEPYDYAANDDTTYSSESRYQAHSASELSDEDCDRQRCTPLQTIKQAIRLWDGQVPSACAAMYPAEPWRCYFGYRAYQTLKTPLFVVQWLYDEAQLLVDNIALPDTNGQWNYVNKVVNEMRASLENVTALFAPSCFSHSLVTRKDWNQISINGLKLPHILNSWEEQSLLEVTPDQSSNPVTLVEDNQRGAVDVPLDKQQLNQSPPSNLAASHRVVPRPTIESLSLDGQESSAGISVVPVSQGSNNRETDRSHQTSNIELRAAKPTTGSSSNNNNNSNRPKGRKRKRNNQQSRLRNVRQRSNQQLDSVSTPMAARDSNELLSLTSPPTSGSVQNLLAPVMVGPQAANLLLGRSERDKLALTNNGRLGRSTVVDEATLLMSNNVPDDVAAIHLPNSNNFEQRNDPGWNWSGDTRLYTLSISAPIQKSPDIYRFRLIDTCGWPQCNRDCPVLNLALS